MREERKIGSTDLRQQLTDVLQAIREERATYVVETFGRPQAALVDLDTYRRFQEYEAERKEFFDRLAETAEANAADNSDLIEEEVLRIIEAARQEVFDEQRS